MANKDGRITGRGQRAYTLRRDEKLNWGDIAERVGYSKYHVAVLGAKRYAQRASLPWPIVLEGSPPQVPGHGGYVKNPTWPDPRPMDTAPRDGTAILLRYHKKNHHTVAFYREGWRDAWSGALISLHVMNVDGWFPLP